jgi:hypothetical protein
MPVLRLMGKVKPCRAFGIVYVFTPSSATILHTCLTRFSRRGNIQRFDVDQYVTNAGN